MSSNKHFTINLFSHALREVLQYRLSQAERLLSGVGFYLQRESLRRDLYLSFETVVVYHHHDSFEALQVSGYGCDCLQTG